MKQKKENSKNSKNFQQSQNFKIFWFGHSFEGWYIYRCEPRTLKSTSNILHRYENCLSSYWVVQIVRSSKEGGGGLPKTNSHYLTWNFSYLKSEHGGGGQKVAKFDQTYYLNGPSTAK